MKFLKLAKLGHRNLTHHKKQTIFTVIVIGALFSILITMQFIIQGLEYFHRQQNLGVFANKIYITAQACQRSQLDSAHEIEKHCIDNHGQLDQDCLRQTMQRPAPCSTDRQQVNQFFTERAKPYGGKVVGNVEVRTTDSSSRLSFYPIEIFKNNISTNLSKRPSDAAAAILTFEKATDLLGIDTKNIISSQDKLNLLQKVKQETIGKTFQINDQTVFIAGILPYGSHKISVARHERDIRPLDFLLENFSFYNDNLGGVFLLNDNSPAIKQLISKTSLYNYQALLEFNSPDRAYDYFKQETGYIAPGLLASQENTSAKYLVAELATKSFNVFESLSIKKFLLSFANYALLITAVIIIVFTFLRLISQDSRLIALYRSLGATARDVWLIYLWYVFELCVLTALFALGVGALLALGISWYYSADFNAAASLFYAKHITSFTPFIGFSWEVAKIIGAILLSAPIVSILTLDQLSIKNVARRLKKQ